MAVISAPDVRSLRLFSASFYANAAAHERPRGGEEIKKRNA
jgi:hypothetical protein